MNQPAATDILQTSLPADQVKSVVDEYKSFHAGTVETRKTNYKTMVNHYYDLVTDFYEFGWGQSFHFAPMFKGEAFAASIARHEHWLAAQLNLKPGMKVLDVGCGVGGPMRAIARFSGATVVGVNNNDYQIKRGDKLNAEAGLANLCSFQKADFMKLPFENNTFDAIYAIEATCHAPDKLKLFTELARTMKPGAHFAGYEWCMTDKYNAGNAEHRAIKKGIEEGDALPDIWTTHDVVAALEGAGLEVVEAKDVAPTADAETPWHTPLKGRFSIDGFKHTEVGRVTTHYFVKALETLKIAPKGSTATSSFLQDAATALVKGGDTGIFTPMFFFHVKKPGSSKSKS
ncbi:MAG: methyltransferase domain-containing protein [Deltaproteobacteria bacterium]|nr:methyltransferase domain-containing protein [Deltaproteobacteria bacterium]